MTYIRSNILNLNGKLMEIKKSTYASILAGLLALSSCSHEGPAATGLTGDGNSIYFRSYLPTVTQTRAGVITKENLKECRVTSFNPNDRKPIDSETGEMTPYFSDIRFEKDGEGRFLPQGEESCIWPDLRSRLHFFAYYPAVETMQETIDDGQFNLVNYSEKAEDGSHVLDYRLERFQVAPDIADQVDFITAYANGTGHDNGENGIELDFTHQLARIELAAWGASDKYDFEIAGVRVGNALTEGDFCFASLISTAGGSASWLKTEQGLVEHIFSSGESIVLISKDGFHSTAENASSIMGNSGPAMVIPMADKIEAWEGKGDSKTGEASYSTDKLYISVLLRVTNRGEETVVYPYPNDSDNIPVVYLAIGGDGMVIRKVYLIDGNYYTSDVKNDDLRYSPGENEEVHGYCWAALPVGAKWEAGKIYSYKLNYTTGIGWQDPSDPNPGEPIIERGKVPFEVNVKEWVAAEDHNPNLDVPKR